MKKCLFCGRINDDDALFCCKCGRAFNEEDNIIAEAMLNYDEIVTAPIPKHLCCPRCRSNHLQATVETSTSAKTRRKGYSPAKGCLGSLLFGSWGWLFGAFGQRRKTVIETINRNYWICADCGNKFRNIRDWREEIKKKEQSVKANLMLSITSAVFAILLFKGNEISAVIGIVFLLIALVNSIIFFLGKAEIKNELQGVDELERSSME